MIFTYYYVMKISTKPVESNLICPMCKRLKSKHSERELKACLRKKLEFTKNKKGGAGIT